MVSFFKIIKTKKLQASFTIEATVIVPMILGIFALIVTLLFYYHDKNVVAAIAHETVVMGCDREEIEKQELEQYFREHTQGKLLVFSKVNPTVEIEKDTITIECVARRRMMKLQMKMSMNRTEPEQYIRRQMGGVK